MTLLPYVAMSLVVLAAAALIGRSWKIHVTFEQHETIHEPRLLAVLVVLFIGCLLAVFRVVHYGIVTVIVVATLLILRRALLRQVDYCLLLTFVFFFIFSGNLAQIPALRDGLAALMGRSALLTSAAVSQAISNVPAAVLLASFTQDWKGLLLGVDLGGLGTPIASLASLISLKFYLRWKGAQPGRYLLWFSIANFALLALLILLAALLGAV